MTKKELLKKEIKEIYFDAGTGRGIGMEVCVTDIEGDSLFILLESKEFSQELKSKSWKLNIFKNIQLSIKEENIAYGELLALKYALLCAKIIDVKKIYGDNNIVINKWSLGDFKAKKMTMETLELIKEVTLLRKKFMKTGGTVELISGNDNPADLGFHKNKYKKDPLLKSFMKFIGHKYATNNSNVSLISLISTFYRLNRLERKIENLRKELNKCTHELHKFQSKIQEDIKEKL
jgi:hypothetical protein